MSMLRRKRKHVNLKTCVTLKDETGDECNRIITREEIQHDVQTVTNIATNSVIRLLSDPTVEKDVKIAALALMGDITKQGTELIRAEANVAVSNNQVDMTQIKYKQFEKLLWRDILYKYENILISLSLSGGFTGGLYYFLTSNGSMLTSFLQDFLINNMDVCKKQDTVSYYRIQRMFFNSVYTIGCGLNSVSHAIVDGGSTVIGTVNTLLHIILLFFLFLFLWWGCNYNPTKYNLSSTQENTNVTTTQIDEEIAVIKKRLDEREQNLKNAPIEENLKKIENVASEKIFEDIKTTLNSPSCTTKDRKKVDESIETMAHTTPTENNMLRNIIIGLGGLGSVVFGSHHMMKQSVNQKSINRAMKRSVNQKSIKLSRSKQMKKPINTSKGRRRRSMKK